jgi:hypothetical protein
MTFLSNDIGASLRQRFSGSLPTTAAKHAQLSKRGQQSQSIDPSRPTSAAVSQSPKSA